MCAVPVLKGSDCSILLKTFGSSCMCCLRPANKAQGMLSDNISCFRPPSACPDAHPLSLFLGDEVSDSSLSDWEFGLFLFGFLWEFVGIECLSLISKNSLQGSYRRLPDISSGCCPFLWWQKNQKRFPRAVSFVETITCVGK